MKENRLYRVVNGRVIGGVAGGLAEFFGIDPTIIRIIFILLTIMGGGGILIYIILWIVVPERYITQSPYSTYTPPINPDSTATGSGVGETYKGFDPMTASGYPETSKKSNKMEGSLIAGLVLILIGGFFLFERYMPNIDFSDFWPLLLILIGIIMIFKGFPGIGSKKDETISNEKDNLTNNDLNL